MALPSSLFNFGQFYWFCMGLGLFLPGVSGVITFIGWFTSHDVVDAGWGYPTCDQIYTGVVTHTKIYHTIPEEQSLFFFNK